LVGLAGIEPRTNDPEQDRNNKDLYLLTNAAGAGEGFEGADATARWWRRDIRMLELKPSSEGSSRDSPGM
jgi:hypothetical protein